MGLEGREELSHRRPLETGAMPLVSMIMAPWAEGSASEEMNQAAPHGARECH